MGITREQVTRELEQMQKTLASVNAAIQDWHNKIEKGEIEKDDIAFELSKADKDKQYCEERIAGLTELREAVEGLEQVDAALRNWKEQIDRGQIDPSEISSELVKAEKDRETYQKIILEQANKLEMHPS